MKSTSLTILLGLSLTLSAAVTSRANDQQTTRIPQGRGQYIEVAVAKPTSVALLVTSRNGSAKDSAAVSTGELRPVTVTNAHGSSVTLYRRAQ